MQPQTEPEEGGIDPEELKKIIFGLARMFEGDRNGARDPARPRPTQPSAGFNTKELQAPPRGGSSIQRDATAIQQAPRPTSPRFSPNKLQPSPGPIQPDATGLTEAGGQSQIANQELMKGLAAIFQEPIVPGSSQEVESKASQTPSIGPSPRSYDPRDYLPAGSGIRENLESGPIGTGLDVIGSLLRDVSPADFETGGLSFFGKPGFRVFLKKIFTGGGRVSDPGLAGLTDEAVEEILRSEGLGDTTKKSLIDEFDKLEADVNYRESREADFLRFAEEDRLQRSRWDDEEERVRLLAQDFRRLDEGSGLEEIGKGRMSTDADPSQLDFDFEAGGSIHIPAERIQVAKARGQLPPLGQRSNTFTVKDEDGNMIGSLGIRDYGDDGGKDLNVWVHEDYRRQGIGTNLYQQAYDAGYDIENLSGYNMSDMGRAFRRGRLDKAAAGTGGVVTTEAAANAPRSEIPIKIPTRTPAPPGGRSPLEQAQADFERASQDFYHSSDPNAVIPRWEDFAPPGTPKMTLAQMQYNELYASQIPPGSPPQPAPADMLAAPQSTPLETLGNELRGERKGPLPVRPGEENRPRGLTGTFGVERPAGEIPPTGMENRPSGETSLSRLQRLGQKAFESADNETSRLYDAAYDTWRHSGYKGPPPHWDDFWTEPTSGIGDKLRMGPLSAGPRTPDQSGGVLSIQTQGPKGPEAYPHGMVGGVNFVDLSRIINQPPEVPGNVLSMNPQGPELPPHGSQEWLDHATAASFDEFLRKWGQPKPTPLHVIPRAEGVDLKAILDQLADTDRLDEMLRMLDTLPPEERIEAGIKWMLANPKGKKPPKPPTGPRLVP